MPPQFSPVYPSACPQFSFPVTYHIPYMCNGMRVYQETGCHSGRLKGWVLSSSLYRNCRPSAAADVYGRRPTALGSSGSTEQRTGSM